MKKKIIAALAITIVSLGFLTACGESAAPGDSIREFKYVYNGKTLYCVKTGFGNTETMSCDWVRYHAEESN